MAAHWEVVGFKLWQITRPAIAIRQKLADLPITLFLNVMASVLPPSINRHSAETHSNWADLGSITTFERLGTIGSTFDLVILDRLNNPTKPPRLDDLPITHL